MHPELFSIGKLTVYSYGFLLALGMLAGLKLAVKSAKYRNISKKFINGMFPGAILFGLLGSRILYVLLKFSDYFGKDGNIFKIFAFWEGGLVFLGGVIGGLLYLIYFTKKWGYDFKSVGDVLAPGLSLSYGIGRLGCFSAGCCYGKPTDSCIGIVFNHPESLAPPGVSLVPTQLISSLFGISFSIFLYFYLKTKKTKYPGLVMALFFAGYSMFRIIIEFFRGDFRGETFLNLTTTQWIALAGILAGIFLFRKINQKNKSV
ncbi:MAG: prolipoprotein diacylglyceryl transferase [Elusimicrobiota bacterium]